MRCLKTMILAFLVTLVGTTASAQAPARTPYVTIEIQGRVGAGAMWVGGTDAHVIPGVESGQADDMNLGATVSVRHYGTGLGITGGYTHAFTGFDTHYGTHAFDVRLSERATFFQHGRTSLSLLIEAGFVTMNGGAHYACPTSWWSEDDDSSCTPHDVSVSGMGGIAVLGLQVRHSALLAGIEADYRHLAGSGALASQDDVMVMARIGVAFDL